MPALISDNQSLFLSYDYLPINPGDAIYGDGQVAIETKRTLFGVLLTSNSYTYDKLGRVTSGPRQTGAEWDALGRLTQTTSLLGIQKFVEYESRSWRLAKWEMTPNGAPGAILRSMFHYETPDPSLGKGRRLTGILHQRPTGPTSGTVFGQHAYQYDALGRLSNWQKWADAAQSKWTNIQHDDEDQLTDIEERDGADTLIGTSGFGYDDAGNRTRSTRMTVATGTVNRVWSANGLNQLTAQTTGPESGPQITYDADGNMLSALRPPNSAAAASTFGYEWDAENRLVAVNYGGGKRVAWAYDAFHRRVKQTDTISGIAKVRDLTWDGLTLIGSREAATGEDRRYYPNGEERQTGTGPILRLFYMRDHLGSIREVVDGTGAIRARYDYTPYGERNKLSGDLDCDFGFTGHYTHEATGLVAAPYRFYDPILGRWLSRDPIEEEGGINLYQYVNNRPEYFNDFLGQSPQEVQSVIDRAVNLHQMMGRAGQRSDSPNFGNARAFLGIGRNLGCVDQQAIVQGSMGNTPGYKAFRQQQSFPPHRWTGYYPSDIRDPVIIVDSWRGTIALVDDAAMRTSSIRVSGDGKTVSKPYWSERDGSAPKPRAGDGAPPLDSGNLRMAVPWSLVGRNTADKVSDIIVAAHASNFAKLETKDIDVSRGVRDHFCAISLSIYTFDLGNQHFREQQS